MHWIPPTIRLKFDHDSIELRVEFDQIAPKSDRIGPLVSWSLSVIITLISQQIVAAGGRKCAEFRS